MHPIQMKNEVVTAVVYGVLRSAALMLTSRTGLSAGLEADMVILNGKILTADSPDPNDFTIAQAAAIYDGKFIAVGSNEEALEFAGPSTQRIDLEGHTVIPGLVETHDHIYGYGSHFFPPGQPQPGKTDPSIPWTNKADGLAQIRTLTLNKQPGEWIITSPSAGLMGVVVELQKGEVTRFDLDSVAPNNPVVLHWSVQSEAIVNTKALEPLLERYPDIPGVRRDDDGVPTGQLAGLAI